MDEMGKAESSKTIAGVMGADDALTLASDEGGSAVPVAGDGCPPRFEKEGG